MSDLLLRGHRCMFKGQPLLGDGEHTRLELYNKVMAAKAKPPKRGAPKVTEPVTEPETIEEPPKPKSKKKKSKK